MSFCFGDRGLCRRGHGGPYHAPALAHDPEKLVLDVIGDGKRFSDKIMRQRSMANRPSIDVYRIRIFFQ
jgi:hypothetical protein